MSSQHGQSLDRNFLDAIFHWYVTAVGALRTAANREQTVTTSLTRSRYECIYQKDTIGGD